MAEYIEKTQLLEKLKHRVSTDDDSKFATGFIKGTNEALGIIEEWIASIPATDVAPVVRGHWTRQDESFTRFKCSNPECGIENCSGFENYCPNCGAKMDGED